MDELTTAEAVHACTDFPAPVNIGGSKCRMDHTTLTVAEGELDPFDRYDLDYEEFSRFYNGRRIDRKLSGSYRSGTWFPGDLKRVVIALMLGPPNFGVDPIKRFNNAVRMRIQPEFHRLLLLSEARHEAPNEHLLGRATFVNEGTVLTQGQVWGEPYRTEAVEARQRGHAQVVRDFEEAAGARGARHTQRVADIRGLYEDHVNEFHDLYVNQPVRFETADGDTEPVAHAVTAQEGQIVRIRLATGGVTNYRVNARGELDEA